MVEDKGLIARLLSWIRGDKDDEAQVRTESRGTTPTTAGPARRDNGSLVHGASGMPAYTPTTVSEARRAEEHVETQVRMEASQRATEAQTRTNEPLGEGRSVTPEGTGHSVTIGESPPGLEARNEDDEDVTDTALERREATEGLTSLVKDDPLPRRRYVARSGDTLRRIAQEQLGDGESWRQLYHANREILSGSESETIPPGTVLDLPE